MTLKSLGAFAAWVLIAHVPVNAETCIISGDTARPAPVASFLSGPGIDLETRTGLSDMGDAADISPFESRIDSLDWGTPMNLNSRPPDGIIFIR